MRGPSFKVTFFLLSNFSWRFQIEISIVGLGSWPVRGPSFKVTFFLLSNFSWRFQIGLGSDFDSWPGELACERPKF